MFTRVAHRVQSRVLTSRPSRLRFTTSSTAQKQKLHPAWTPAQSDTEKYISEKNREYLVKAKAEIKARLADIDSQMEEINRLERQHQIWIDAWAKMYDTNGR